ncbi:FIG01048127: hypothetical protein [Salmonella enterica subsp. enterica serovar Manhattan str. 111113]|nr:FIG01048127: hypothetical protein [Salmonella enterica subsp. enterica serovar Manhattan str. 111113]
MRVKQICRPDKAFTPPSGIVFVKMPDGGFALSGLRFDCSGFQE